MMHKTPHPDFIPFNRPHLIGLELEYIRQAVMTGKISGNGTFTQRCQQFLKHRYGLGKALLTTSATAALEMAALLLDLRPGDEVLMPSFTFTSTANAFVLRGARIVFVDSSPEHPNMNVAQLASMITPRTRAIVPVHYAGVACDMASIMDLATHHNLVVIEDAAQAIESFYQQQPLGSIGHLAAFSFHETKNIIAGEGGLLAINDPRFAARAEVLWEKGTNRASFFRGETAKYQWVDVGSSFLPSEITAAYLLAQLEELSQIQTRRQHQWNRYHAALQPLAELGAFVIPIIPAYATHNAHIFYLLCADSFQRQALISHLAERHILAVFHYQTLHNSPFYQDRHDGRELPYATHYDECLVRLPLFFNLTEAEQQVVIEAVISFFMVCA